MNDRFYHHETEHDVVDGEYRIISENGSGPQQGPPNRKKKIGTSSAFGIGAVLLFLATKGKAILYALFSLLKYSKFLGSGVSMFIMIWVYSLHYGWAYAVGIVLMIAIHEFGHLVFAKAVGMPVSLPFFVPFLGAFISMKEPPKNAWQEAVVAVGGPFFGLVAALVAFYWGMAEQNGLVLAIAYFSFFITLFNMIPISPLDGGRIVTALSPWVWGVGVVVMGLAAFYTMSPLMIIIAFFGGYRALQTWKQRDNLRYSAYFDVTPVQRVLIGVAYVVITVLSGWGVYLFVQ